MEKWTKEEMVQAKNIIFAFKKATFNDMQGMEILAFNQALQWFTAMVIKQEKLMNEQPKVEVKKEEKKKGKKK